MKLLLDTHILFWCLTSDSRLEKRHRDFVLDASNQAYVSAATGWEVAVKVSLGKWPEASILLPGLAAKIKAAGMGILPLSLEQAEAAGSMPRGHKDPFDRIIAVQALELDLTLLTVDPVFVTLGCKVA